MNINETGVLLSKITVSYPNFKINDLEMAVTVWAETLREYSLEDCNKALIIYNRESHQFAPSAGTLIEIIRKYKPSKYPPAAVAVKRLMKALRNTTYNAQQEFEELPEVLQRIIGSAGRLKRISESGFKNYEEAFIREYERECRADEEKKSLLGMQKSQKELPKLP